MKKFLFAFVIIAALVFGSCASKSSEIKMPDNTTVVVDSCTVDSVAVDSCTVE